jgi:hypothetical protein
VLIVQFPAIAALSAMPAFHLTSRVADSAKPELVPL